MNIPDEHISCFTFRSSMLLGFQPATWEMSMLSEVRVTVQNMSRKMNKMIFFHSGLSANIPLNVIQFEFII